ncbi:MAG: YcxB family protein [Lachnospiraceae bacterium]|nr:YcxB family protein [Lachnospiraceae bacterium]
MRIVTLINDEDYIAFNEAYQFKSSEGRNSVSKYIIMFAILLGLSVLVTFLVLLADVFDGKILLADLLVPIGMAVYCTVILATFKSRIRKRIRKKVEKYRAEGNLTYDSEATIDLTDEMIMEYTPKSTIRREWRDIKSIIADDGHYYLMVGPMQGLIIPFRCLGAEANTFLPYVQQRTGLGVIK